MYLAHSGIKGGGRAEPLSEHLGLVAGRAENYAGVFGAGKEARVAGMLHDLGKYSERFLRRLENKEQGLDHWSAGAFTALAHYKWNSLGAALAIQGHHIGLQHGYPHLLRNDLNLRKLSENHPLNLRLTEMDHKLLLQRLQDDGLCLPPDPEESVYDAKSPSVAGMLDVRMLFSALVDADYIETEAHFEGDIDGTKRYRPEGPGLDAGRAVDILDAYLDNLPRQASKQMIRIRDDLCRACVDAAQGPPGLFTLSAPTGAGKTLAMLAFALRHARENPDTLRRVVMVIPYLSIIEQTARIYRNIFKPHFGPHYVIEHHSLTGLRGTSKTNGQDNEYTARLLAENWDAPLIITTSVQCLESLFSYRPGACRKLHRLAGSIILFDEVQTLPPRLAIPTLAALSHLAERYGTSVVFSTATQPAFSHLHEKVRGYTPNGWQPQEMVPENLDLFGRAHRTRVIWNIESPCSWQTLAEKLSRDENARTLCILNLKRHAQHLFELLKEKEVPGIFHLSTNMCPAHREQVLTEVRKHLNPQAPQPCRLISTQCVEAGVDVDFPVVYRAFGPLEAIAQAAGRCNRNGNLAQAGVVSVFMPEPEGEGKRLYPPGGYRDAADVTEALLKKFGPEGMDINDIRLFEIYYKMLYDLVKNADLAPELKDALDRRHFVDTAEQYRLIKQDAINILTPYNQEAYQELRRQLEKDGRLTRAWINKVRPYTVSLFRPKQDDEAWNFMQAAPTGFNTWSEDWFIYLKPEHYSPEIGLNPFRGIDAWMV